MDKNAKPWQIRSAVVSNELNNSRTVLVAATLAASVLGLGALYLLVQTSHLPPDSLHERKPGLDRPAGVALASEKSPFESAKLIPGDGKASDLPGAWPQFRGAKGDNIAADGVKLAREWKPVPRTLWSVDLGEGYAGAAVRDGRVYLLDYDMEAKADALRCLSLADGKEIWRFTYPVKTKRNHGMSRTVPTLVDKYVVTFGPKCHIACLEAETGKFVWGLDLVKDFGATVPEWYAGQCPLVDGDRVILGVGGDALLMAVELATGKVIWKTPNPRDWKMTHSSIVPFEFAGKRQYVYVASGGVVGVNAADGALLWETDAWKISIAAVPTPVPVGSDRIFFSGGYNSGAMMMRLKEDAGKIVTETVFRLKPTEFGAAQQTPILFDGHLYGIRPDGQLACLDLDGKIRWTSGATAKFGLGPLVIGDGLIFALNDDGWLTLAEAAPSGYRPLAKARALEGHDCWAPMALVHGRLLARDLTKMVCLDVKQ